MGLGFGIYSGNMKADTIQSNPFFRFLRKLRADGRTNMYGAVPYLMSRFGLSREQAFRIVCEWLDQQALPEPSTSRPETRKPARRRSA
jgi:hypothetical protein